MRRVAVGFLMLAMLGTVAQVEARPIAPPPSHACAPFVDHPGPVAVRWSVVEQTARCFFFSGPGTLGRNDRLGEQAQWSVEGSRRTLRFAPSIVFGSAAPESAGPSTGAFRLQRESQHPFGAQPWRVEERIEGAIIQGDCPRFVGEYTYTECERGAATCPGPCRIRATVVIEGVRAP